MTNERHGRRIFTVPFSWKGLFPYLGNPGHVNTKQVNDLIKT
jgi:hypothetical protein